MTVRTRFSLLTTGVLLAGALLATTTTPTQAASAKSAAPVTATVTRGTGSGAAKAVEWYPTTSRGGLIRECYKATCDWYYRTSPGDKLLWSHNAYNEFGSLWYYVDNGLTRGWIYCGNVTAGC
ncbi:hypothetical protein ACWCXE_26995 [Streptomyces sp. NPDC001780]